jgi:hypothetical protein
MPCDWTGSVILTWVIRSNTHMCLHLGHCGCVSRDTIQYNYHIPRGSELSSHLVSIITERKRGLLISSATSGW